MTLKHTTAIQAPLQMFVKIMTQGCCYKLMKFWHKNHFLMMISRSLFPLEAPHCIRVWLILHFPKYRFQKYRLLARGVQTEFRKYPRGTLKSANPHLYSIQNRATGITYWSYSWHSCKRNYLLIYVKLNIHSHFVNYQSTGYFVIYIVVIFLAFL